MTIFPTKVPLKNRGSIILITLLFAVGAFFRLYNFPNRLIFSPEQSISLLTSASYLDKFSLLGEVNVQRATSQGHNPFHGAYFNYALVPLILLFRYQPLGISYIFVILNLFTALIFYLISKNIFGKNLAFFALFYFLFSDKMIHHSLFIWNLNFLPLLGILSLYSLVSLIRHPKNNSYSFWIGIISGVGFGLQYLFAPFIVLIFVISFVLSRDKIRSTFAFLMGSLLGSLSMVLFDIRHDFYYVRTLYQYFLDVVNHQVSGGIHYYDLMYLLPFLFLFYALLTVLLYKVYKPLSLFPMILFLYGTLNSPLVNLKVSTGMPPGITLKTLESASAVIAGDKPPTRFNVATLWDFDTQAHPLRYFLTYYYKQLPQPVEEYRNLDALYVFAPADYDMVIPRVWELQSFLPYKTAALPLDIPGYKLYKLTK